MHCAVYMSRIGYGRTKKQILVVQALVKRMVPQILLQMIAQEKGSENYDEFTTLIHILAGNCNNTTL